jgi:hypothetical protein
MRYYFVIYTDYNGEKKSATVPKDRARGEENAR